MRTLPNATSHDATAKTMPRAPNCSRLARVKAGMKTSESLLSNTRRDPVAIPPGISRDQLVRPPSIRCAVHHQMSEEPTTSRVRLAKGFPIVQ
jgi:hypothetical protein